MIKNGSVRVKGIMQEIRAERNSRLKVVAYKKGKDFIDDPEQLKEEFPPSGYVFAYNIYQYKLGALVELDVVLHQASGSNQDQYTANEKSKHQPTGYRLFSFPEQTLNSPLSVNMDELLRLVTGFGELSDFYFQTDLFIYGPFDFKEGAVFSRPDTGRCYASTAKILSYEDVSYLAKREQMEKIDTYDADQLEKWFKTRVATLNTKFDVVDDLNGILKAQSSTSLDHIRLQRAFQILNEFRFTQNELSQLCKQSSLLQTSFDSFLEKAETEILVPIKEEKQEINNSIQRLLEKKKEINSLIENQNKEISLLKVDLSMLREDRDREIHHLRMQALVDPIKTNVKELIKYDLIEYRGTGEEYQNFADFGRSLVNSLDIGEQNGRLAVQTFAQLSEHAYILVDQLEFILHAAQCAGNCSLFIQQVEADWLKFDYLYNHGLKAAWEKALNNPQIPCFFVLQDFNLAAFECYAKPLMDVLAGRRKALPGYPAGKPENFWLFLIPIINDSKFEFGLPLIPNSYKDFAGFVSLPPLNVPNARQYPILSINQVKSNLLPLENHIQTYLNQDE